MTEYQRAREVVSYSRNSYSHGFSQFKKRLENAAKRTKSDIIIDFANDDIEGHELRVLIPALNYVNGSGRCVHIIAKPTVRETLQKKKITGLTKIVMYDRPEPNIEKEKRIKREKEFQKTYNEIETVVNGLGSLDFLCMNN
jgi:hypothetical protein